MAFVEFNNTLMGKERTKNQNQTKNLLFSVIMDSVWDAAQG